MNLAEDGSGLRDAFGAGTPWIAGGLLIFLVVLIGAAFLQNRPLTLLWGTVIGPRRSAAARPVVIEPPGDLREYATVNAGAFYTAIAAQYDQRNSRSLHSTQLETVKRLQQIRADRAGLAVLDLGGGTGAIALHFFNEPAVSWTYVDFCPDMAELFRQNLAGTLLGANSEIRVEDLTSAANLLEPAAYDVVMLSLVLSSMPSMPSFAALARLLKPGGALIITDINPGYTRDNPLYQVRVNGELVALRTTPVDPTEIIRRANAAGLRYTELTPFGTGSTYYSFITVFTPLTARPVTGHGDGAVLQA